MFVRYDYKLGASVADLISDVVKLLTGTTDKTQLSPSCTQANSYIISDDPAGWSVYDAGYNVVRAQNVDALTYKYVKITCNGATMLFNTYENWNNGTHVGTNQCYNSDTQGITVNPNVGGTLLISCSVRGFVVMGLVGSTWSYPVGVMEHSRDEPWDTPAFGQPAFGFFASTFFAGSSYAQNGAYYGFCKPRRKNGLSSDATGASAALWPATLFSGTTGYAPLPYGSPNGKMRDANYVLVHGLFPIQVLAPEYNSVEMTIGGRLYSIYVTTSGAGMTGDEITYNGKTYFVMQATGSDATRLVVPKF